MTAPAGRWTLGLDGTGAPDRALIGGKAASIARMMALALNAPPAFVITTAACAAYQSGGYPTDLDAEIDTGLAWLETKTGRRFGSGAPPLLLSVRSGAAISMPGMMDTVLNLGITDEAEQALAAESGRPDFARDTHRRFLELYAAIVLKCAPLHLARDGFAGAWRRQIEEAAATDFPSSPRDQLRSAVCAVFESWNSRRARKYREHHGIDHTLGTAVAIQAMVFGNLDQNSGTGVLFSRNPLTGERTPFGEYLPMAQGEDVVSGKFTPLRLDAMRERVDDAYAQLLEACARLERDGRDAQDIEFTVQRGKLFLLQSRAAKRAPRAAVRIAVEMAEEGLITRSEAIERVSAEQVQEMLRPRLREGAAAGLSPAASGEGACPGVATGRAVATPDEAERLAAAGQSAVLVRETTSPDDVHGMIAACAVVTAQGGATSHAAVVSRALGRPCVVGCGPSVHGLIGDVVTVDGGGQIWRGALPLDTPGEDSDPWLTKILSWACAAGETKFEKPSDEDAVRIVASVGS